MRNRNSKFEFVALLLFLTTMTLLLTNGFVARISAEDKEVDVYRAIDPIGIVLGTILEEYVREVDLDKVVEGSLAGMMGSLDRHSSFISAEMLKEMREDTKGEFEGIGVSIKLDQNNRIMVFTPIAGSPAAEAGIRPFDIIVKIDGISTEGMSLNEAADKIKGPRGTSVKLTLEREEEGKKITKEVSVKRAKLPLESVKEARILTDGIGYMRITDFKDNTALDMGKKLKEFLDNGMQSFILDLRWNPGGLLSASKDVCELFLPKKSLVTYTKGREKDWKANKDDMQLYTEKRPVLPPGLPVIVLVNGQTASSAEIVTGALQFYQRALVIGQKTFGKGSVQTIIPLERPKMTALRLTTALYYTPADVTIDHQGILPDIEVVMTEEQEKLLGIQMYRSYENDPSKVNEQNHGTVTGNVAAPNASNAEQEEAVLQQVETVYGSEARKVLEEVGRRVKATKQTTEDLPLLRAVEVLQEDRVWENLLKKYHRDIHETQMAAQENATQPAPEDTPEEGPEGESLPGIEEVIPPELLPESPAPEVPTP